MGGSISYHCISCIETDNMSGFDDDFGEMVGDKEAPPPLVEEVLAADDPAAEFLAREQEQLGDLEADIGPLSVSPQKSPIIVEKKVKEEPAVIREWREKQMEMLRKKDEEEENSRNRERSSSPGASRLVCPECHPDGQVEGDQQSCHGE